MAEAGRVMEWHGEVCLVCRSSWVKVYSDGWRSCGCCHSKWFYGDWLKKGGDTMWYVNYNDPLYGRVWNCGILDGNDEHIAQCNSEHGAVIASALDMQKVLEEMQELYLQWKYGVDYGDCLNYTDAQIVTMLGIKAKEALVKIKEKGGT